MGGAYKFELGGSSVGERVRSKDCVSDLSNISLELLVDHIVARLQEMTGVRGEFHNFY